jgi:light-independent protochlorophyllide reductase subunit B
MEEHLLWIFGEHDTKEVVTKEISTNSDFNWNQN